MGIFFISVPQLRRSDMDYRCGFGYDIHRLEPGDGLMLGGVKIPCTLSTVAHSDGDCLLHSLANAIFSSIGLDDIGTYFSNSSEDTLGMNSKTIVAKAMEKLKESGYKLSNAVVDINLEKPHISAYRDEIKKALSSLLGLPLERIAVHANTGEGLGSVGSGSAIVVYSMVCVVDSEVK